METRKLSRRSFLKTAAITGGAALIASCAPPSVSGPAANTPAAGEKPAENPPAQAGGTLVVWNADWGKDYNDPMITLSDNWIKDENPGVKVEWTFLPKLSDKLSAAVAGGNPPDVAIIDESYGTPKMARAKGLIALDNYYQADSIKKEDFIPFTWETVLFKEKIYGMPGGAGVVAAFFDNGVLADAGIDAASLPDTPTWDQFIDWNNKLLKKDSAGKVTRIGVNSGGWNAQFAGVLEFEYYSADRTKLACNSPKSIAALKKWHGLLPEGVNYEEISTMLSSASASTPYADFATGISGMLFDGYWMFLALDKYYPDMKYSITKLPTPNGTKEEWPMYTGWVWNPTIPVGVKQVDMAWKFIKYGFWSKGEMLADTINWTSSLQSFDKFVARTEKIMGPDNRELPGLHHFTEMQYEGKYAVPYTPVNQEYLDAIGAAYDEVVRLGKDMQAAMDEVVATIQPKLDKALAEG